VSYAVVLERNDRSNGVYCPACAGRLVCADEDLESTREFTRVLLASGPVVRLR
jgi:hypothetical protein